MEKLLLLCRDECLPRILFARMSCALLVFFLCLFSVLLSIFFPSRYERQGELSIKDGSD